MWKNHACQADAIVMASVSSIKSFLSADESQVFTDYKMTPLTITKDDNLIPGVSFYITQPGGIVHIDGGEITDLGAEYPSPLLPNEVYLLFLKTTKSTNTFRPLDNLSTYLLDSYRIRTITESADRDSMNNFLRNLSPDSLPTTLRQNLLTCSTGTSSPATSDLSQ